MKKNMVLIMSGFVTLLFVICIGYVFTSPTPKTEITQINLEEQDATALNDTNSLPLSKNPPLDSTNSLVFNANSNTTEITTPPLPKEEKEIPPTYTAQTEKTESLQSFIEQKKQEKQKELEQQKEQEAVIENSFQQQELIPLEKEDITINNTTQIEENTLNQETLTNKDIEQKQETTITPKKENNEEKEDTILQDKLPVPFVKDSLKTQVILAPKKNANTIIYAQLLMDGNQVGLVIEGDKPIKPKTFRLQNPNRVVVDIEGSWIIKLPRLISNRMVKEIRSNTQQDKTRIVFDLKTPVSSSLLYRIHNRKYQLVFK